MLQKLRWLKHQTNNIKKKIRVAKNYGENRYCPVCEKSFKGFFEFGNPARCDAICVNCEALERHRLLWLLLQKNLTLLKKSSTKFLHIAPEKCFEQRIEKALGDGYITADLYNTNTKVQMDITDIQYPDNYFDVVLCNHVLEHIIDDKKAMREFYRVLKNDGCAIITVPIYNHTTYEDSSIISPEARLIAFDQEDHVRKCGYDYIDRIKDAGFLVQVIRPSDLANEKDILRLGLTIASGEIYCCTTIK